MDLDLYEFQESSCIVFQLLVQFWKTMGNNVTVFRTFSLEFYGKSNKVGKDSRNYEEVP